MILPINAKKFSKYSELPSDVAIRQAHSEWDCISYDCSLCKGENIRRFNSVDGSVSWEVNSDYAFIVFSVFVEEIQRFSKLLIPVDQAGEFGAKCEGMADVVGIVLHSEFGRYRGDGQWRVLAGASRFESATGRFVGIASDCGHFRVQYND